MKKVTVITSSLRAKSTSKTLMNEMVKGLKEHNEVKIIDISHMDLKYCIGCMTCQETGKCVLHDSVKDVIEDVNSANTLIFVTPIYYYSVSGQLKTFLDRMNPLYPREDRKFKEVYALFTCADDNPEAVKKPTAAIEGWVECFDGVEYKGSYDGLALNDVGDITEEQLKGAYEFGSKV